MSNFKSFGRVSSDISISYVGQNNTAVAKFSIAVNRRANKDGKSIADFHNVQAWGKTAEAIEKYFRKGDRICIEGEVQNNNYTDKNGTKHYGYVINLSDFDFIETKKDREQNTQTQADDFGTPPVDDIPLPDEPAPEPKPKAKKQAEPQPQTPPPSDDDEFMKVPEGMEDDIPYF